MKKYCLYSSVFCVITLLCLAVFVHAGPKGAKAIFDSGEGPAVSMSVARTPSGDSVQKEKYVGISYQLLLMSDDGQFKVVPKTRTFKSGERLKMLVRTNRPGYMTILNIGPTGNTNVLFNDNIEAFALTEIPRNTNLRLVGTPGTEKLLIMLSNEPNPLGSQQTMTAANALPAPTTPAGSTLPPPPPPSDLGNLPTQRSPESFGESANTASLPPPPPPPMLVSSLEGAKSVKGSKDIVVEDDMKSSYAVISPRNNWKPVNKGMKDIVLESSGGNNYGVIPVSNLSDGKILTLEVKLKHQ